MRVLRTTWAAWAARARHWRVYGRLHWRRLLAVSLVLALLLVFEVGVRLLAPDAVEIQVTDSTGAHVLYDQTTTNATVAQADYRAITATPGRLSFAQPSCPGHMALDLPAANQATVRFLWHGLPIAVAVHSGQPDTLTAWLTCSVPGVWYQWAWYMSSGGLPTPWPFINQSIVPHTS